VSAINYLISQMLTHKKHKSGSSDVVRTLVFRKIKDRSPDKRLSPSYGLWCIFKKQSKPLIFVPPFWHLRNVTTPYKDTPSPGVKLKNPNSFELSEFQKKGKISASYAEPACKVEVYDHVRKSRQNELCRYFVPAINSLISRMLTHKQMHKCPATTLLKNRNNPHAVSWV